MSTLDSQIHMRIKKRSMTRFKKRCKSLGRSHQDVIREMVEAFGDKRLTIKPTNEDGYHVN